MEPSEEAAGNSGSMTTQNLYAALGLSAEDVEALAQIPENEISVETLPYLIMQLKAKRAEKAGTSDEAGVEQAAEANQEPVEKSKDRRVSPPPSSSSSTRRSDNHDGEHHGKGEASRKAERPGQTGRRDSRHRKSSRERQSGDGSAVVMEVDDNPIVFPHVCSLCKAKVNGPKQWSDHLRGGRHSAARRNFMRFSSPYSEDESYLSRHGSRSSLPSKRSYSSERGTGELSSSDRHFPHMPFTRVVVAKYPMGSVAVSDMLALGKQFGTIVKHLIFPVKGFLEFSSHAEAKDMVNYYHTKPAFIKGHRISLCLSPTVEVIHLPETHEPGSKRSKLSNQCVVCFSRLPPGKETEEEVLELASLFGDVRQAKFSEDKALIEMVDWRDADIMLKYYHSNPLRIQDKSIKVTLSSLSSLRDGSPERSSSKKSESSKSHSSRPKCETTPSSSSFKAVSQSCNKERDKDKDRNPSKDPAAESKQEKPGQEEVKDTDMKEEEEEEAAAAKTEQQKDTELGGEPGLPDADAAVGVAVGTEEEVGEQEKTVEGGGEEAEEEEEERGEGEEMEVVKVEEERAPAVREEPEIRAERGSEEEVEEQDDLEEMDFPENMDDFVTLDELDNTTADSSELQEGKVVVIRPIRKEMRVTRKQAVQDALLKMAEPFGQVVNFAISYYRHEALIELETPEKANEMVKYYKSSKRSKLCGRPVSVAMCLAFNRIEGPSGRSLFISMLPSFKYSNSSVVRLAQPFGKVTAYCVNRMYGTCYIQMETKEAAEKMIQKYSCRPPKFYRTTLKVAMCRKGDSQIPWTSTHELDRWCEKKSSRDGEEKRLNGAGEDQHSPESGYEGVCGDPADEAEDNEKKEEEEERAPSPLGPYQAENPVGLDYVVPMSGFFCKLCNVFYTDEKKARTDHCSSLEHYNRLKRKRGEAEDERTEAQTDE